MATTTFKVFLAILSFVFHILFQTINRISCYAWKYKLKVVAKERWQSGISESFVLSLHELMWVNKFKITLMHTYVWAKWGTGLRMRYGEPWRTSYKFKNVLFKLNISSFLLKLMQVIENCCLFLLRLQICIKLLTFKACMFMCESFLLLRNLN